MSRPQPDILRKLAASTFVVVAGAAFLVLWGPRPSAGGPDIYVPLARASGFLLPPPGAGTEMSPPLPVRINGQVFHYRTGRSDLPIAGVLDNYDTQLRSGAEATAHPVPNTFRLQGPRMGVLGGIAVDGGGASSDLERMVSGLKAGRLSALGQFHVVVAFEDSGTLFLHFMPDPDVRWDRLFASATGDAPGEDIAPAGRPAGSRRLLTMEQGKGVTFSRTVIYRVGDPDLALAEVTGRLERSGFAANEELRRTGRSQGVVHFVRDGEECFAASLAESGDSLLAIVLKAAGA